MANSHSTRRAFLRAAGGGALGLSWRAAGWGRPAQRPKELLLYVGTYTTGRSQGIYLYRLDLTSGALSHVATTTGIANPSYLAINGRRSHLYAVTEVQQVAGRPGGAVGSFAIDQKTGQLRPLNQQPSGGAGPCYVTVDAAGKHVLVANYGGGSVSVLPVQADGSLGAPTDTVQHEGKGADPRRQEGPHAHCIVLDKANRHALAVDLGLDKVLVYRFDAARGKLTPNQPPWAEVKAGAGPRHIALHPTGRHAYVINELDSTVTAFDYDGARGTLKQSQTITTLPPGSTGPSYCADVHVSASGKFLYGSNRGHNSIAVFAIEPGTGRLAPVEHRPTEGQWPRNFTLDPTGTFLLAANQRTDTVVTFRVDPATGRLTPTGHIAEIPAPVCLKLIPPFA